MFFKTFMLKTLLANLTPVRFFFCHVSKHKTGCQYFDLAHAYT
jgi:hypothetical protein